jgi:hypothetical protein
MLVSLDVCMLLRFIHHTEIRLYTMTINSETTTPGNPALSHQTLLKALQDLIVQVVDSRRKNGMGSVDYLQLSTRKSEA